MHATVSRVWRPEPAAVWRAALLVALMGVASGADAVDWTGRVSLLGGVSHPLNGDVGKARDVGDGAVQSPTADQQSLRLMAQDQNDAGEWSLHVQASRLNQRGLVGRGAQTNALFRWRRLAGDSVCGDGVSRSTRLAWDIDRAVYKRRFERATLSIGRQPVDFGSGRFWQPLNVFGAFAPTDLDTDYKPGIDALVLNTYPSNFSSLTAVYALAPQGQTAIKNSAALHHRRPLGESSQAALLVARVVGQTQIGASFESDWRGLGWRVEALHTRADAGGSAANTLFWIAGIDYRFDNGTHLVLEWHDDGRGATSGAQLKAVAGSRSVVQGLQQQLARRVLGLSLQKDLSPLWSAQYAMLGTSLRQTAGGHSPSLLHQLSLVHSLNNESDLMLALVYGSGDGLNRGLGQGGQLRSTFGHQPISATLRWRVYF